MKLDRRLNLTAEVKADFGTVYVHSVPISRETFEAHFLLIAKVFAKVYNEDLGSVAGPRVAALLLRKFAREDRELTGQDEALMNEIRRLTNVTFIKDGKWESQSFADVIEHGLLDLDSITEVENILVYFTLASTMPQKDRIAASLILMNILWHTGNTPLDFTAYQASIRTSTTEDDTTKKSKEVTSLSQVPH